VIGLLLALAVKPAPDALAGTRTQVERECRDHASSPKSGWALAHGITAFGADFKASDGRLAVDAIAHDFAHLGADGAWRFEPFVAGEPVEPHLHLIAKTLVLAGVPLDRPLAHEPKPFVLQDLVDAARKGFATPRTSSDWAASAWTLDLLAHVPTPDPTQIHAQSLAALDQLEQDTAFLGAAMDAGRPMVKKAHQGIWSHPCGGFHFVQAVLTSLRAPDDQKALRARIDRQIDILFYRLLAETRVYAEALEQAPPELKIRILLQRLKFHGHWLETVGRLRSEGVLVPTPDQGKQVALGRVLLSRAVDELAAAGGFGAKLQAEWAAKPETKQLALDLAGDACHAFNGLRLTEPR
jgi:hypothetical protein